jgi:hypothetical protein
MFGNKSSVICLQYSQLSCYEKTNEFGARKGFDWGISKFQCLKEEWAKRTEKS